MYANRLIILINTNGNVLNTVTQTGNKNKQFNKIILFKKHNVNE